MNIEVCITNLGNGKHTYGNMSSLDNASNLQRVVNLLGINDIFNTPIYIAIWFL